MKSHVGEGSRDSSKLSQLVNGWWFHYDEWCPEALRALIADDFNFRCRSDTGATAYEDFIRVDLTGADEVMAWQETHRLASPYPLRHHCSNILFTSHRDGVTAFTASISVTKVVDGRPHALSSGIVHGAAQESGGQLVLAKLQVVLDTRESVAYSDLPTIAP